MQKYAFHLDPPKKCFTPTLGVNTKTCLIGFHPPNKCSKVLVAISQSFIAENRPGAMQKLFIKKRKKELKKWTSVRDMENNGYSDVHLKRKKEMNKIAHVLLQKCFQV